MIIRVNGERGDLEILFVSPRVHSKGIGYAASLRGKPGFCPAYHMNKDKWITILLDRLAEKEDITALLAMSYTMTATKIRRVKHVPDNETV